MQARKPQNYTKLMEGLSQLEKAGYSDEALDAYIKLIKSFKTVKEGPSVLVTRYVKKAKYYGEHFAVIPLDLLSADKVYRGVNEINRKRCKNPPFPDEELVAVMSNKKGTVVSWKMSEA